MCVGLPDQLIAAIQEYGGDAVAYKCTDCRASSDLGVDKDAFKQLYQTVKTLCETVKSLSAQVGTLTKPSPDLPSPPGAGSDAGLGLAPLGVAGFAREERTRMLIREEIREMNERQKRVSSVIVRGIDAPDTQAFTRAFDSVANHLLGGPLEYHDLVIISREKRLYRLKVPDAQTRQRLLEGARSLKDSQFMGVYISRDLTYQQRQDLARRRQARSDGNSNPQASARPTDAGSAHSTSAASSSQPPL